MAVVVGQIYRHYKGGKYKVLAVGNHTETNEEMVVYKNLVDKKVWIRPRKIFEEKITRDTSNFTDRFTLVR